MYMEKEQKKNEQKEKKPLTEQQRQQRRKMLVYPLMGLLFLGCLWLIFAPSSEDREKAKQGQGFNTHRTKAPKISFGAFCLLLHPTFGYFAVADRTYLRRSLQNI